MFVWIKLIIPYLNYLDRFFSICKCVIVITLAPLLEFIAVVVESTFKN